MNKSVFLSYHMLNMVFIVILLSIATTFSLYASDDGKKRADRRINNGVEKFIVRYKKYGNWDIVIALNKKRLKKSPGNQWILRNLGKAYRKINNLELSDKFLNKAIKKDLAILHSKPWKASTNRSLVRSYRLKGDWPKSKIYLSKALNIGLKRIKKHPESANALYSLGKTYILMGEIKKAKPLFVQAYKLKPTDKDFRREYYKYN